MKRELELLLQKACDALVLSIEFFNRTHNCERDSSTLIQVDHAFKMPLRASILHREGTRIGTSVFKRYSQKAIEAIKETLQRESTDAIWAKRSGGRGKP